jgi:hypothetical protein
MSLELVSPLLSHESLGNQVDSFLTVYWGAQGTCIPRLRMKISGRHDDAVKLFEPRDVLYFANECSDAVSLRTLL